MNYKSFGFTKFIPRIPEERFGAVVKASSNASNALGIWESVCVRNCEDVLYRRIDLYQLKEHIYSIAPEASLLIGKRSLGHISNYYPGQVISDEEVAAVQAAAEKHGVNVLNTRCVVHFEKGLSSKLHKD